MFKRADLCDYFDFIINHSHPNSDYFPIELQRWSSYDDFLKSTQWCEKRTIAYDYWGVDCFQCLSKAKSIHHLNYYQLWGDEIVKRDLIPLCNQCHARNHIEFIPSTFSPALVYNYKIKQLLIKCGKIQKEKE